MSYQNLARANLSIRADPSVACAKLHTVRTPKLILRIASVGFFGFGIWALIDPGSMLEMVGSFLTAPAARAETRAFYGGLEIGFGLFLLISARRDDYVEPASLAATMIFFGCALTRALSMAWEPVFSFPLFFSGLGEAAGGCMTAYGFHVSQKHRAGA
jgi:hypothetical protein